MSRNSKNKVESVASLFPGINEMADEPVEESALEEADSEDEMAYEAKDPAEDDMNETLELSESELESIYREALQLEVDVKKGFSDMSKPHEFGAGAKGQYQSDPANLADYASGEKEWDDVEPPAKKKWTVESLRPLIKQGLAENRTLSTRNARLAEQNAKLTEMVKKMHSSLAEMNLLNSKIMHVNKFMNRHGKMTSEQQRSVVESIDKAGTVTEVKRIFSILESSFRAAGAISESRVRRPHADSQKRRTSGEPNREVLRESAGKSNGDRELNRMRQLAGLVNG